MEFGGNSQKLVYGSKFNVRTATFLGERTLIGMPFGNISYGTQNGTQNYIFHLKIAKIGF